MVKFRSDEIGQIQEEFSWVENRPESGRLYHKRKEEDFEFGVI